MKTTLALAFAAIALPASAQTYIAPDFSTGTPANPPTTYTVGTPFTTMTSGDGTIAYSGNTMTVGSASTSGAAYIQSSESVPNSNIINTSLTFTPTYSDTDPTGSNAGQTNLVLFQLIPTVGANNAVLSVVLQTLGYGADQASIQLLSGIAFGGASTVGNFQYNSHGVNSLSGVTLTLNLQQVFVTDPNGVSTITTTGTLSDAANADLYDYSYVTSKSNVDTGYDPANGLAFQVGLVQSGASPSVAGIDGNGNPYDAFTNGPSSVVFSNVSLSGPVTVPEPSTLALMLGGVGALAFIARRRLVA